MTAPILRPYQTHAIELVRQARRSGARRILLACPTGGGKSVIATEMIRSAVERFSSRALVVAHRKELIDQFYVHLGRVGIVPGILRGQDDRTDPSSLVQVGTIQTLARRTPPPADLVVVDEAHRAPSDSYVELVAKYPRATILGLTATPCRTSGEDLPFDALVEVASYSELIDQGAIEAPIVYAPKKDVDLSRVRKVAGDYHEGELEAAMMKPSLVGDVVKTWSERAEGRRTVVFACSIAHSRALAEEFSGAGARARHLDGNTPEDEREQILVDLEVGKLDVVCNVDVLTEGWDQPSAKCGVIARPTLSLTKHMQMAGRFLRPWQGVKPVLLDHAGNVYRHGLPHEDRVWSLDGTAKRKSPIALRICGGCFAYVESMPCPLCGFQNTRPERKPIAKAPGVLERIDAQIARERAAVDPKRAFYDAQVAMCRKKGWRPGAAAARYKEKFDDKWPPWAWSQETKVAYEADADWQERVKVRTWEREKWQAIAAEREARTPEPSHGYTQEPEEGELWPQQ